VSVTAPSILILTNGPLARNPRVVKEATTLGDAGYAVTVLTPRNHAASEPFDAAIALGAPFTRVPLDLLPGFGTSNWRVFFRLLHHRLSRIAMTRLRWPSLHALGPAGLILKAARNHAADLTIAHNEVPHGVGLRLLAAGRRVAADIEDWHSEDLLPAARRHRPITLLQANERALLHHAAYTTTTSERLAEALHTRYGGRHPTVVTNSFPLGPVSSPPARRAPKLLWFSQTIGPGRGLEAFVTAWAETRGPSELTLLGEDLAGFGATLRERLPASLRDHFYLEPLVAPEVLPSLIARYDIGLALEHSEPASRDLTITNKILQYLNAGLAVIATPTAGQREVFAHSPAIGLLLDLTAPAAAAAARLDALIRDPELPARRAAARQLAETRYCWEREAPRLLALVAGALERPNS
jgi:glycosyltransferase involved in cell wall biosynthesis